MLVTMGCRLFNFSCTVYHIHKFMTQGEVLSGDRFMAYRIHLMGLKWLWHADLKVTHAKEHRSGRIDGILLSHAEYLDAQVTETSKPK